MKSLLAKSKKMKNKKGFTLIELIVVIVIIGILAAIIVPRLSGFSDKAQASACKANQSTIETASAAIYAETGTYPADVAAILAYAGAEYFSETPTCPTAADGVESYFIDPDTGVVTCLIDATHND